MPTQTWRRSVLPLSCSRLRLAAVFFLFHFFGYQFAAAQCGFTNLDAQYCVDQSSFILTGAPNFFGPGISGTTFSPSSAGTGTHTLYATSGIANTYNVVTSGVYNFITTGFGPPTSLTKDTETGLIGIGFTFNFFGTNFTQVRLGSNGLLGFGAGPPVTAAANPTYPNAFDPDNLIAAAWDDMGAVTNTEVRVQVIGAAPLRKFVADFDMVSSVGSYPVRTQIHLYESTNVIEIHTQTARFQTNGNFATQAIEGPDPADTGSAYYVVSGRNNESWDASNDFVAFVPTCLDTRTVTVNPLPLNGLSVSPLSTAICANQAVGITIIGDQAGVEYQLQNTVASTPLSGFFPGDGVGNLTITSVPLTANTTVKVSARIVATGCDVDLLGTSTVAINPTPGTPSITSPAGPVTQCEGSGDVLLTSNTPLGTSSYQWYRNGIAIGGATAITHTVIDNPANTGTYTVTAVGILPTACSSAQAPPISITINALPQDRTVTPVLPTTVCSGQTVTLTVVSSQSGINYEILDQSSNVVSGIVVGTGGNVNITSNALSTSVTSLRVRATNASTTCTRLLDAADAVVVNSIPLAPTITPAGATTVCEGSPDVVLNSSAGSGNQWYFNGSMLPGETGTSLIIATLPGNSGNYTVTQTVSGCSSAQSAAVSVTINALPQDRTVTPVLPTTVCSGQTVTLTVVSSQSGINYEILDQSSNVVSGIVVGMGSDLAITSNALSTSVTSLRVRATNASTTCTRLLDAADAVVVNAIPGTPAITGPVGPIVQCEGTGNITLISNTPVGTSTYQWFRNGLAIGGAFSMSYVVADDPASSGDYTVAAIGVGSTFCSSPQSVPVSITINPQVLADAGLDNTYCEGSTVTLGGSPTASGGNGVYTFLWSSPGFTSTLSNPVVAPSVTTTYQLTVTDANACNAIDNVVISVNPVPSLAVTPDQQTICNGGSANIVASSTLPGAQFTWTVAQTGVSGASDQLIPGGGVVAHTLTLDVSNLPGTATYTIRSVSPAGCVSAPMVVIVNVLPVPDAQAFPVTICSGQNGNVFIDNPNNVTGTTFSWTALLISGSAGGFGPGNGNTINQILTTTPPGNGVVRYTITPSAFGCSGTATTVDVTVNPRPVLSSTLTPAAICSGLTFGYTATSGTGGATFAWSRAAIGGILEAANAGSGDVSETLTNVTTAPINVTYVYTVTANGCSGSSQNVVVTVNPNPVLSSTLTPSSICSGALFSYTPTSATTGATFSWSRDPVAGITPVGPTSGTNNPNETLTNTTTAPISVTYQYTVNANGCSTVQNVVVTVNPTPVLTSTLAPAAICSGSAFGYTALSSTAGATFSWTRASVVGIAEAAGSGTGNVSEVLTNTTTGPLNVTYAYTVSANGCTNASVFNVVVTVQPVANFTVTNSAPAVCEGVPTAIQINELTTGLQLRLSSVVATGGVTGFTASGALFNTFPATIADNLTNPTNAPQTVTYTFEGSISGTCVNPALQVVLVTVNPAPPGLSITNLTPDICVGTPNDITLSSLTAGAVITLTNVNYNGATGTLTNGTTYTSGSKITETLGNPSSSPIVVTYTLQVAANGCTNPATQSTTVTVKPLPVFSILNSAPAICSGSVTDITLNTPTSGGVVRVDAVSYGAVTGGTAVVGSTFTNGQKITDALVNSTTSPITVTYTFSVSTPLPVPACLNPAQQTIQVVVSPSPSMSIANVAPVICTGASTNFSLNSPTSGAVIRLVAVNYGAAAGTLTAGQMFLAGTTITETLTNATSGPVTVIYTFDVTANGCTDAGPFNTTVTVQPPALFAATNGAAVLCEGLPTAISITSTATGQRVHVANVIATGGVTGFTAIGTQFNSFPASISDVLDNPTNAPQTVTYVLEGSIGGTCINPVTQSLVVTVNPAPPDLSIVNAAPVVCAGTPNDITLNSATAGAVITLTAVNYNGAIGTLSAGATRTPGSKITETLVNSTNAPITVDYTFQVSANGCTSPATQSTQVTVKPNPTFSIANSAFVICSGTSTNISFTSLTTGHQINSVSVSYGAVTGGTVVPGVTTFVNGSVLAEVLTNPTSAAIDVTYQFNVTTPAPIPSCPLMPGAQSVTVRVLPTPSASASNITICSGSAAVIPISAAPKSVVGTTFDWTITPSANVLGAAAGNGSTINQVLTLTNSSVGSVTYHIVPTANGCAGPVHDVTVTVNPVATVDAGVDYQVCEPISVPLSGIVGGAASSGTWTIVSGAGSIGTSTSALPNVTAVYNVGPADLGGFVVLGLQTNDPDGAGPCVAVSDQVRIDINRRPVVTVPADFIVCEPASIALTGSLQGSATTGLWSVVTGAGTLTATNIVPGSPITALATYTPDGTDIGSVVTFRLTTNDADGPSGPCVQEFDDINITINRKADISAGVDLEQCADIPSIQILGSITYAPSGVVWSIQPPGSGVISNPTIAQPSYSFNNPTEVNTAIILRLTANDPDGTGPCVAEFDEMNLRINPLPLVVFTGGYPSAVAENNGLITITGNQAGGLFTTSPGVGLSATTQSPLDRAIFDPDAAFIGLNNIYYQYQNPMTSCVNSDTLQIVVNPVTTIDFSIENATQNTMGEYQFCSNQGKLDLNGLPVASSGLLGTRFEGVGADSAYVQQRISQTGANFELDTDNMISKTYLIRYVYVNSFGATTRLIKIVNVFASPLPEISTTNSCVVDFINFFDATPPLVTPFPTTIASWDWNLDDGNFATSQNTSIRYSTPGFKDVTLTVRTAAPQNCVATAYKQIRVGDFPIVDFDFSALCNRDSTRFEENVAPGTISTITSYTWTFDDGFFLSGAAGVPVPPGTNGGRTSGTYDRPFHKYDVSSSYDVSLSVTTNDFCTNSFTKRIFILQQATITPNSSSAYRQDFELNDGNWFPEAVGASDTSWVYGIPTGTSINSSNGTKSWWTGLNGNSYFHNEKSHINGPCFDLTALSRPMISLDYYSDTERNLDGAVLQYSINGGLTWFNIGPPIGTPAADFDQGIEWYNSQTVTSNPGNQIASIDGWTDKQGRWKTGRFNLDMIPAGALNRDQVRIRIAFASNLGNAPGLAFDGFAFDNVYVGEKERINLVEHFTNYNLAASVTGDTWLDNRLAEQIALHGGNTDFYDIRYHIGFPTSDQFYQENSNDPDARSLFYGVSQPPSTVMDGRLDKKFTGNFTEITRVEIDRRALAAPLFKIRIDTIATGNSNTITPEVEALYLGKTPFTDPLLIQAALIETPVTTPSSGTFRNVLRKQLFGGDGETVSLTFDPIQPGLDTASVTRSRVNVTIDVPVQNSNNLWMIAYVQNKLTKEVYQTAIFKVTGKAGQTIVGVDEERPSAVVFRELLIHPNPADDEFAFRSYHDMRGYQWKMSDQRGVVVKQGDFTNSLDGDTWVEVSELPNGVYTLLVASPDGGTMYKRLVVMNRN